MNEGNGLSGLAYPYDKNLFPHVFRLLYKLACFGAFGNNLIRGRYVPSRHMKSGILIHSKGHGSGINGQPS